jgi:hypothetical protein
VTARSLVSLARRADVHERRLAAARSQTDRFWVAAGWLIVEARQVGRLREVVGWMLAQVEELRSQRTAQIRSAAPIEQFRARLDEDTDREWRGRRRAG